MKKVMLVGLFLAFAAVGTAHAQTTDLPGAGIAPGNPFYFVDSFFERVQLALTFGDSAKAERYLSFAEERLSEAKVLAGGGNERAQEAVARFEEQVAEAKERANQVEELDVESKLADATTKHLSVLDEVLERVPEEAKGAIRDAKERSINGQIEAMRDIAEEDPERAAEIFERAAEGRLLSAQARAERGGEGEADDVEDALNEFSEYAAFGEEISTLAQGLESGDSTVEEIVERATSRHLEILEDVRSRVPEEAHEGIDRAMENAQRAQDRRPDAASRGQQRGGAPNDTGTNEASENAQGDSEQRIPPQAQEGDDDEADDANENADEGNNGAPDDIPTDGTSNRP